MNICYACCSTFEIFSLAKVFSQFVVVIVVIG